MEAKALYEQLCEANENYNEKKFVEWYLRYKDFFEHLCEKMLAVANLGKRSYKIEFPECKESEIEYIEKWIMQNGFKEWNIALVRDRIVTICDIPQMTEEKCIICTYEITFNW